MTYFETLLRFDLEALANWIFLAVTGLIAWYGISHRKVDGKADFVNLLFGVVGAIFFALVLFQDLIP
ncbi:MAG TPA: hypothetical protein ENI69_00020 [Rhodospirillales bacterium]|nr:hypothetical protein [Rhodospirillales bacterium]